MWASSLLFALVQELTELWDVQAGSIDGKLDSVPSPSRRPLTPSLLPPCAVGAASARVAAYNKFVSRIDELDLPGAVDAKPILDVSRAVFASLLFSLLPVHKLTTAPTLRLFLLIRLAVVRLDGPRAATFHFPSARTV